VEFCGLTIFCITTLTLVLPFPSVVFGFPTATTLSLASLAMVCQLEGYSKVISSPLNVLGLFVSPDV